MGDVQIYHPISGGRAVVASSAVPILAGSGWRPVEGQDDMGEVLPPEVAPFEGQPVVHMRHPDLDTVITVAESAAPIHASQGWVRIEAEAETEPEPSPEPKPRRRSKQQEAPAEPATTEEA